MADSKRYMDWYENHSRIWKVPGYFLSMAVISQ